MVVVVVLVAAFVVLWDGGLPTYEVHVVEVDASPTPARLDRGQKLTAMLCRRCHADLRGGALVGRDVPELGEWGSIHAANLTADREHGIGEWSASEIVYVLRTGVNPKDGELLPPYMIRLPRAADEDVLAIAAFFGSAHAWVQPEPIDDPPSAPSWRVRLQALVDWKPSGVPGRPIPLPPHDDPVALGRYLVDDLLGCYGCHSPKSDGIEPPAQVDHYLAGGKPMRDINGKSIPSKNLTPDPVAGIGGWTLADFRRAFVDGFRPDGTLVRWPMRRHAELSDAEVEAIFAYLHTVAADAKRVPLAEPYKIVGPRADAGQHVFHKYGCHYCHGEHGRDLKDGGGSFPTDAELVAFLRHPELVHAGTEMPTWDGVIADDEYEPLVVYIRGLAKK